MDILDKDEKVFEKLLTTDEFIVAYATPSQVGNRLRGAREGARERPDGMQAAAFRDGRTPPLVGGHKYGTPATRAYGIHWDEWDYPIEQPFKQPVPRVGLLTHPAWLVAWSSNFNNDIIRRGKWIREHLLADAMPDLPIGVDAQLPEDPHRTLRNRMQVTRAEECWRCHKQMDPLGMAFEMYDDFGRYRDGRILLGDEVAHQSKLHRYGNQRSNTLKEIWKLEALGPEARAQKIEVLKERIAISKPPEIDHERYHEIVEEIKRNKEKWTAEIAELSKKGDNTERLRKIAELRKKLSELTPPEPEHSALVDSAGVLTGTRDPELDGPYKDVHDLMHRLAKSDRVRQSFIRHAFRYFMGRNEMLSDSPTLMAMDKAYRDSGGSFKEVLVTLMVSDSFLTRKFED